MLFSVSSMLLEAHHYEVYSVDVLCGTHHEDLDSPVRRRLVSRVLCNWAGRWLDGRQIFSASFRYFPIAPRQAESLSVPVHTLGITSCRNVRFFDERLPVRSTAAASVKETERNVFDGALALHTAVDSHRLPFLSVISSVPSAFLPGGTVHWFVVLSSSSTAASWTLPYLAATRLGRRRLSSPFATRSRAPGTTIL